jgi:anthranilate phosphoribosyltransferase
VNYAHLIKEIGRGAEGSKDLDEVDAHQLYGAMLDGGVPELELGAVLIALRMKGESLGELLGFGAAVEERLARLVPPAGKPKPVVLPSYNGARHQPNLTPLLALLLARFGVPVLVHGELTGNGRIASAYILRELGVMPCASAAQAQTALDEQGIAYLPTAALCPGLASLLALRSRLGVRNSAHFIAKLTDPFAGDGLRVVSASHPPYLARMREYFVATGGAALLLRSTEGEPFANPKRRPQLDFIHDGVVDTLFEAEVGPVKTLPTLPEGIEAAPTAQWIKRALAGDAPVPLPIINQLACLLYACGYAHDMNQAKAIVAVEAGSLAAA